MQKFDLALIKNPRYTPIIKRLAEATNEFTQVGETDITVEDMEYAQALDAKSKGSSDPETGDMFALPAHISVLIDIGFGGDGKKGFLGKKGFAVSVKNFEKLKIEKR